MPLADAFLATSPRARPPVTPWAARAIHGGVALLWVLLFVPVLFGHGPWAWATGIVYVSYDTFLLGFTAWRARELFRAAPAPAAAIRGRPTLAVLIAARNEAAALPATLAALLGGDDRPGRVLIADDGSSDGTAAWLREAFGLARPPLGGVTQAQAGGVRIAWLRLPGGGKARALNAALAHVDEDVVVTIDADTLLRPGALGAMRRRFTVDPSLVAATGVLIPVTGGRTAGARLMGWFQRYEYVRNFLSRYAWMRADGLLLISGAFAGFRRAALAEVGGFDTDCLVEDYELVHRLRRHAALTGRVWRTAVVGGAVAVTDAPASVPAFLRQRRRWFGGFLQTQWWYRSMVGDRRFGRLGTWMLPVKAFDTLQPIYGLAALGIIFAVIAGARWDVLRVIAIITLIKIVIDIIFHLWSLSVYRRWTGEGERPGAGAVAASLIEPFSFQILRHTAAALGWVTALTGRHRWAASRPTATPALVPAE